MEMTLVDESPDGGDGITKDGGFAVRVTNAFQSYTIDFQPPCRVRCDTQRLYSILF